jgi:hypothetical protein
MFRTLSSLYGKKSRKADPLARAVLWHRGSGRDQHLVEFGFDLSGLPSLPLSLTVSAESTGDLARFLFLPVDFGPNCVPVAQLNLRILAAVHNLSCKPEKTSARRLYRGNTAVALCCFVTAV